MDSAVVSPQVTWTTSAWFEAQPASNLEVCIDTACQAVPRPHAPSHKFPLYMRTGLSSPSQVFTLTVAGTQGSAVLATSSTRASMTTWTADAGTCFAQNGHRIQATLTALA
ncbi:MAG: hypothetical protein JWP75_1118 [Frondihabitans sp.]|nr:hypothetical protein [Frondihabitans sp.]